ncbi:MAG TPA: carboxypeptidase-like regulatory domain-containing protein [Paludibacter sp.]|nr:carboxypeptidase-like regulatory domain-containing protein [Paludibacter sp.]
MKTQKCILFNSFVINCLIVLALSPFSVMASTFLPTTQHANQDSFNEYRAKVVDRKNGEMLTYASVLVVGSNVSTVTNSEGEFSLKIGKELLDAKIVISHIGYKSKTVTLAEVTQDKAKVELEPTSVELPEISVVSKNAEALIREVLDRKDKNYSSDLNRMTAFYRETIKKGRSYVSLSEAVAEIYKQPYNSYKNDIVTLFKARKKADYSKLDTVAFKLQGGPFNSLYLDIMRYPDMIFTDEMLANYEFTFDRSTYMDKRLIFVIDFKQRAGVVDPLYYGKLYIDAKNYAMKSAVFNLNLQSREMASKMFVLKKPFNADVYPVEASYRIDYTEKDGKWYYSYSRIQLGLKINWKKRLFKTTYNSTIEMAVTDWELDTDTKLASPKDRIKPSIVISDEAVGFSDPSFWGEYNVIEPEKSIESAIKKIQKQLEKK